MARLLVVLVASATVMACAPRPPTTPCQVDTDCILVDDYCDTCSCLPATRGYAPEECDEPACVSVLPLCHDRTAACVKGECAVASAAPNAN